MSYEFLVVAHLLIIGYWLGTDLAVYYISGAIVDGTKPVQVRVFAARTMLLLDMVPRSALILTLLTGLVLTTRVWLPPDFALSGVGWLWLWPVLLAWMALTWTVFKLEHQPLGHTLAQIDFFIRLLVTVTCLALGWVLWESQPWLTLKLMLLALIICLGLVIRIQLKPFGPLFAKVAGGQPDAAVDRALARLIGRVRFPVWVIWLALISAALIGRLKPVFV